MMAWICALHVWGAIKKRSTLENHALGISNLFLKCRVLAVSALLMASFNFMFAKKKTVIMPNVVAISRQNEKFPDAS